MSMEVGIPIAHVPNPWSSNVFHFYGNSISCLQLWQMGFCFFLIKITVQI